MANNFTGVSLKTAMALMGDTGEKVVYIGKTDSYAEPKAVMPAIQARLKYGNETVTRIRPYIMCDGEYVGNIYVIPDHEM